MSVTAPPEIIGTEQAPPRTRWRLPRVRVSVRALMGLVLVLAIGLGWYVRSVHIQQDTVAAIRAAGGSVEYQSPWLDYNPDIISSDGRFQAPRWLTRLVPLDYAANVVRIDFSRRGRRYLRGPSAPSDDETLAQVGRLRHVTNLDLDRTAITDAGLAHLEGLTSLRSLRISDTRVGDAGLAHLKGMTHLSGLFIARTRVTDEGVLGLERALPRLRVYRDEEMFAPGTETDLDAARSQPVCRACALLGYRAQIMKDRRDDPGFIATVEALCDLEARDKLSLIRLAEARAGCLGFLDPFHTPGLSDALRQALRRRCTDRAMDALTRAVDLGYDNIHRLDGDHEELRTFANLRDHPPFRKLVRAVKAKSPSQ